jgi:AraC-type transcriptional regulator
MLGWGVRSSADILDEIRWLISVHARPDMLTPIVGLSLAKVDAVVPEHSLTEPLLVVLAQGGKRILLGSNVFEYRAGQCLVVTASLPVTGNFLGACPETPAMGLELVLRASAIAPLLQQIPAEQWSDCTTAPPAIDTSDASLDLLDALARLLRLLDNPDDIPVLAPMIEREVLGRLLTGPHGAMVRQVGLADSGLSQVSRVIQWIRDNYAEPIRIADLARLAGMSESARDRPSTVVTSAPSAATANVRQDTTRLPLSSTVHAPHCPRSQPFSVLCGRSVPGVRQARSYGCRHSAGASHC